MTGSTSALMGADELDRAVAALANSIAAGRRPGNALALVGIRTRGLPLAERLARRLVHDHSVPVAVGAVDITLYRDDLSQIGVAPVLRGTEVPFSVDAKEVVLVDDVLFTGRTIRAAMDTVFDLGRPAAIRLAVLVDRGHRELPIQPDYWAARIATTRNERIELRLKETDGVDEVRKELLG